MRWEAERWVGGVQTARDKCTRVRPRDATERRASERPAQPHTPTPGLVRAQAGANTPPERWGCGPAPRRRRPPPGCAPDGRRDGPGQPVVCHVEARQLRQVEGALRDGARQLIVAHVEALDVHQLPNLVAGVAREPERGRGAWARAGVGGPKVGLEAFRGGRMLVCKACAWRGGQKVAGRSSTGQGGGL